MANPANRQGKIKLNFSDKNCGKSVLSRNPPVLKMAMTFNAMFNAIFDQISKQVVDTFHPKREDGKDATANDVRIVCDRVMAESFIQITFGGKESKVLHKPEEYKSCSFLLTRGERAGETCNKKAKTGCEFCSTHSAAAEKAKVKKPTCEHVFTKGKNPGSVCAATVSEGGKFCSKHKKSSTVVSSESEGEETKKKATVKVPTAKGKPSVKVVASKKKAAVVEQEEAEDISESEVEFEEAVDDSNSEEEHEHSDDE